MQSFDTDYQGAQFASQMTAGCKISSLGESRRVLKFLHLRRERDSDWETSTGKGSSSSLVFHMRASLMSFNKKTRVLDMSLVAFVHADSPASVSAPAKCSVTRGLQHLRPSRASHCSGLDLTGAPKK